jgi:hypothetical protein
MKLYEPSNDNKVGGAVVECRRLDLYAVRVAEVWPEGKSSG